jgi:hypothetical protein
MQLLKILRNNKKRTLIALDSILVFCVCLILFLGVYSLLNYDKCGLGYPLQINRGFEAEELLCFNSSLERTDFIEKFMSGEDRVKIGDNYINYTNGVNSSELHENAISGD